MITDIPLASSPQSSVGPRHPPNETSICPRCVCVIEPLLRLITLANYVVAYFDVKFSPLCKFNNYKISLPYL